MGRSSKLRRIAVVTGTRAEFGLLRSVMRAIEMHAKLRLQVIACGLHLSTGTWREISASGFTIDARVPMQRRGRSGRLEDVAAVARGIAGMGGAIESLQPDVLLVLGDRIEALAAATAGSIGGVRVAHLHGGDRAEGVADEAMRHAISKLSHLHFPATRSSARRLIRMGESAEFVWCVGSPAVDELQEVSRAERPAGIIVCQHPIGAAEDLEKRWMMQTLAAAERAARAARGGADESLTVIGPNRDPGSEGIRRAIAAAGLRAEHFPRAEFVRRLAGARMIVGNSSAGLIESAVLRVPCVNVGPRQAGREKPANVIDCDYGRQAVERAIAAAERLDLGRMRHPYGDGNTGERIAEYLAGLDLQLVPLRKRNAY